MSGSQGVDNINAEAARGARNSAAMNPHMTRKKLFALSRLSPELNTSLLEFCKIPVCFGGNVRNGSVNHALDDCPSSADDLENWTQPN
jgi:hypothetical protein